MSDKSQTCFVEFLCCTPDIPSELDWIIGDLIVREQTKQRIERNYNTSDYEKTKVFKNCCFVDVDCHLGDMADRCTYTNKYQGGSTCTTCEQWICNDHVNIHKFCTSCGKQMYNKLEKEIIDGQLDANELINLLFLREEETNLSLEEEEDRLWLKEELKSIEEQQSPDEPDMICCHVDYISQTCEISEVRCNKNAVKYCSDCKMCFCSDHQTGFCRCGKVVSYYERSQLLQKLIDERNEADKSAQLYYLENRHEWIW